MKRFDPGIPQDAIMAFEGAIGFERMAGYFFSRLPANRDQRMRVISNELGEFVAAVTNLAFAVELYLKALLILSNSAPKKGSHDLAELFDLLPNEIRKSLELAFSEKRDATPVENLEAIELSVTSINSPPVDQKKTIACRKTLREVLQAERDAFPTWRYIFQTDVRNGPAVIPVEYCQLSLICQTIHHYVESRLKNKGPQST